MSQGDCACWWLSSLLHSWLGKGAQLVCRYFRLNGDSNAWHLDCKKKSFHSNIKSCVALRLLREKKASIQIRLNGDGNA